MSQPQDTRRHDDREGDHMKALVYESPRRMGLRELPDPVAGPGDAVIRVAYSGICGSELSGFLGQNSLRGPGAVFGHEFSGTLHALGPGPQAGAAGAALTVGQPVTANPFVGCGHCPWCRTGQEQRCAARQLLSASLPGANAELVRVPARCVHILPAGMSLSDAAIVEPAACAWRAISLGAVPPTGTALVVGAGTIGLLVLAALKAGGVRDVLVADTNEARLQIAARAGARVLDPRAGDLGSAVTQLTGGGVDAAFDAAGTDATRAACVGAVHTGGAVVLIGLHDASSPIAVNDVVRREVQLRGCFAYSGAEFAEALALCADGRLGLPEGVVEADLADGTAWFDQLLTGAGAVTKVLLRPNPVTAR